VKEYPVAVTRLVSVALTVKRKTRYVTSSATVRRLMKPLFVYHLTESVDLCPDSSGLHCSLSPCLWGGDRPEFETPQRNSGVW